MEKDKGISEKLRKYVRNLSEWLTFSKLYVTEKRMKGGLIRRRRNSSLQIDKLSDNAYELHGDYFMDKEWIPVVAALSGGLIAVIGGIVAGFFNRSNLKLQLQHQVEQEAKKQNLAKLEELYESLAETSKAAYWFRSNIVQNNGREFTTEWANSIHENLYKYVNKSITLIEIYAPEFYKNQQIYIQSFQQLITTGNECLSFKLKTFEKLEADFLTFQAISEELFRNVGDKTRQYTGIKIEELLQP